MSDALDLIAEARDRQERAERDRDYWKERAATERKRCKRVIDLANLRPMEPPDLDAEGQAHWEELRFIVDEFARVIADPYAVFQDEEDDCSITHERIKQLTTMSLQRMIEAAVKRHAKRTP